MVVQCSTNTSRFQGNQRIFVQLVAHHRQSETMRVRSACKAHISCRQPYYSDTLANSNSLFLQVTTQEEPTYLATPLDLYSRENDQVVG